jgi:hypothetical protein
VRSRGMHRPFESFRREPPIDREIIPDATRLGEGHVRR